MKGYTVYQLNIETLSPLHIGNQEVLSSAGEFLTFGQEIIFLKHEALFAEIQAKGKLKAYTQHILQEGQNIDFYQLLKDWDIDPTQPAFVEKIVPFQQKGDVIYQNNELQRCIKTNDAAYLPGSSLKGAIRTALLMANLQQSPELLATIESDLRKQLEHGEGLRALNKYLATRAKKGNPILPQALFEALRIEDSEAIADEATCVVQMYRAHLYGQETEGLDWFLEAIVTDSHLQTQMTVLKNKVPENFAYWKSGDLSTIVQTLNASTRLMLQFERRLLQDSNTELAKSLMEKVDRLLKMISESKDQFALLRLGKGKTLFFQTILSLLSDELREDILARIKKDNTDFLKTRTLAAVDNQMLGWLKIEFAKKTAALPENTVAKIIDRKTVLKVLVTAPKEVSFLLNGQPFSAIPLSISGKGRITEGDVIEVIVQQSKAGQVRQVKLRPPALDLDFSGLKGFG